MSKKLTVLFMPVEGVGHINACIGLAEALQSRGHKIIFVTTERSKQSIENYGFEVEVITNVKENSNEVPKTKEESIQEMIDGFMKSGLLTSKSALEKYRIMKDSEMFKDTVEDCINNEPQMNQIMSKINPDLIVIDDFIGRPSLIYSGKPWIFLFSGNPLYVIDDERTPPGCSGLSAKYDKDSDEWKELRYLNKTLYDKFNNQFNQWLTENGFPIPENNKLLPDSPYLNLYQYPEELDYTDLRPIPEKFFRTDTLMRKGETEFELPEQLKNRDEKNEKLIYFSLGSMGSVNIELMQRLVAILSKSKHKFIVSKGLLGDKYELGDNMWGQNNVPQTKVLPLVDLVITHGGNNTVTETFSFGKPMIVLPLFADQFDNAQRLHEKGFGLRMDAHNCTEEELLSGIEKLLNDQQLKDRLNTASQRIKNSKTISEAVQIIEDLVD